MYKTTPEGLPVDVDGRLTSVSGKRQAIALLKGRANPNPALYEVEVYFNKGVSVGGVPSITYDVSSCPVSIFTIAPISVVLLPSSPSAEVSIFSSFGWELVEGKDFADVQPTTGADGTYSVTLTRTSTLGAGYLEFRESVTGKIVKVHVTNSDATGWILTTGFWEDLRFWEANGIWNY